MAVFVDTGGWFAASVQSDSDHLAASSFLESNRDRLVTSDLVMVELLTLFRVRKQMPSAKLWIEQVLRGECDIIRATDDDFKQATDDFFRFADKGWSFTDCVSRVMMERLAI